MNKPRRPLPPRDSKGRFMKRPVPVPRSYRGFTELAFGVALLLTIAACNIATVF